MKYKILTIIATLSFFISFSQENEPQELLLSDDSWGKEIIKMPIHFAPKIPYKGVEEIRFAPNWSKQDSEEYWSYVFVWDINLNKVLTTKQLEVYLQYYFDGLMEVVNKKKDTVLPKTIALFIKKEHVKNTHEFVGKLQIYNAFHTHAVMQLNCTVQQYFCEERQKSLVLFRFSPQSLDHSIWNKLNEIRLIESKCN
ncbi:hypothetical protein [Kordia zhangzhouensis]|uniref:hypothetical protein n=1 Tax=Kordia zhangzhouensis TaxID=1620405 RepID=UPI00062915C5|nr:hypothetical protein [Kordia zhangzhouensis]